MVRQVLSFLLTRMRYIQVFVDMLENEEASGVALKDSKVPLLLEISDAYLYNFPVHGQTKLEQETTSYNFPAAITYNDIKEQFHEIEEYPIIETISAPHAKKKAKSRRISNFNFEFCEDIFIRENILHKHLLVKHNVAVVCSVCQERFSDRELFQEHLKDFR